MGPVIAAIGFVLAFGLVWHIWWLTILSFGAAVATMIVRGFARDTTRIVTAQEVRQQHHRWIDAGEAATARESEDERRQAKDGPAKNKAKGGVPGGRKT